MLQGTADVNFTGNQLLVIPNRTNWMKLAPISDNETYVVLGLAIYVPYVILAPGY